MASRLPFMLIGPRKLPSKAAAVSLLWLMLVLALTTFGCVREEDITLEQRAHQLARQLMCPVCDGQTIDGSNAQIAQDMRVKVRELLDDGKTNAEVKEYFVLRYGEEVLAAPGGSGFNLIAWIVPFFIVIGGVGITLLTIRNLRRSNARSAAPAVADTGRNGVSEDLAEYLAQVDRDLGVSSEPVASGMESKSPESNNEVES